MIVSLRLRGPDYKRSMSAYLRTYIDDGTIFYCPEAPRNIPHIKDIWAAGDDWQDPDITDSKADPAHSSNCFYWNYPLLLEDGTIFKGPQKSTGRPGQSKLLSSCMFAYYPDTNWNWPNTFGSCNKMKKASKSSTTQEYPSHWVLNSYNYQSERTNTNLKLRAVYIDGHIETYQAKDTVPAKIIAKDGKKIPACPSPGVFFLPENAVN